MRPSTPLFAFRNFHFPGIVLTLNSPCSHPRLALNNELHNERRIRPMQQVEKREWWLWGFAITVTLVLTAGIVSLTFPDNHLLQTPSGLTSRSGFAGWHALYSYSTSTRFISNSNSSEFVAN